MRGAHIRPIPYSAESASLTAARLGRSLHAMAGDHDEEDDETVSVDGLEE